MSDDELYKVFEGYNAIAEFNFDSENGIVTIDGSTPICSISDIKIERKAGERYSNVTLKFIANVTVNGKLLMENLMSTETVKEIEKLLHSNKF